MELLEERRLMAIVAGSCFLDVNNNNAADTGDQLISPITVYVDLNNDGSLTSGEPSITTQSGGFNMSGVPAGTYHVRETNTGVFFSTNAPTVTLADNSALSVSLSNVLTVFPLTQKLSSNDAYTLRRSASGTQYELAVSGGPTYTLPLNVPSIQVLGGDFNDTLTVDYSNGNPIPTGGVSFDGGTQTDTLIVNGSAGADTFTLNDGTVSNGGTITYANTESMTLNSQAGNDTVNVIIDKVSTTVNGGDDNDTVNAGPGTLDNIFAPFAVNGGAGADTVTLDDSLTAFPDTYTITSTTVSRAFFGGLTYGTIESLNLLGETADNVYNIQSTAVPTTFTDNGGNDTFNLAPTAQDIVSLQGTLTINAGTGVDSIHVNDATPDLANVLYTFTSNTFTRGAFAGLLYTGTESFFLDGDSVGNTTYNITTDDCPLNLSDAGGNDTFNVGGADLGYVPGTVTIDAGPGTDVINVNDAGASSSDPYQLSAGFVSRGGTFQVNYSNAEAVNLTGGTGDDTYSVLGTAVGTLLTITDSTGTDEFDVGDGNLGHAPAPITINANGDPIFVNDGALFDNLTYAISATTLTRPGFGGLTYSGESQLSLDGQKGDNTYQISGTEAGKSLVVSDSDGDNYFIIGALSANLDNFQGGISIIAGAGSDAVFLDDTAAAFSDSYNITASTVSRFLFGGLTYSNVESLVISGEAGNNTYNISSTSAAVRVDDGVGNNTFNVGTGNLDALQGALTINAGVGVDVLNVNDSAVAHGDTYTITATTLARNNFGGLTYGGADVMYLYGQTGANIYNINSTATAVPVYLFDASGPDTINVTQTAFGGGVFLFLGNGNDAVNVSANGFAVFPNQQRIGALTVSSGGYLQLMAGVGSVLTASSISTTGTGRLDLTDGAAIIDYNGKSPFDAIFNDLISGRNGGSWNGPGILSSTAAITPGHALGYGENSVLGKSTFAGQSVDGSSILIRYTRDGDADLDGDTDGVDIGTWATNFTGELGGIRSKFWTQGDWDYDGDVDGVDAGKWAQAFTGELGGGGGSGLGLIEGTAPTSIKLPNASFSRTKIPIERMSAAVLD
jgi:hypothetical protein